MKILKIKTVIAGAVIILAGAVSVFAADSISAYSEKYISYIEKKMADIKNLKEDVSAIQNGFSRKTDQENIAVPSCELPITKSLSLLSQPMISTLSPDSSFSEKACAESKK